MPYLKRLLLYEEEEYHIYNSSSRGFIGYQFGRISLIFEWKYYGNINEITTIRFYKWRRNVKFLDFSKITCFFE
jgi:hypothetical protein